MVWGTLLVFGSGTIFGACVVVALNYWLLKKYWDTLHDAESIASKKIYTKAELPQRLRNYEPEVGSEEEEYPTESCFAVNFIIHQLFRELRDTVGIKRYFLRMFKQDFENMMKNTSASTIVRRVEVINLNFGSQMPQIEGVRMLAPDVGVLGESSELDVAFDLNYKGGFEATIHADLIFGKTAELKIKLTELVGTLQFSIRHFAYPHYFFSFIEEPYMLLEVSSTFDGKAFAQLNSLIISQIRRSIRKRHTLPAKRLRFMPFFTSPKDRIADPVVHVDGLPVFVGELTVEIVGADGLKPKPGCRVWCTLSLEPPVVDSESPGDVKNIVHSVDIPVTKSPDGTIGVIFRQIILGGTRQVIVERIAAGSAASQSNLNDGDIISKINGKRITSPKHAGKLVKQGQKTIVVTVVREELLERDEKVTSPLPESESSKKVLFKTKSVPLSEQPTWNESSTFDLEKQQRYLHVCLYERKLDKKGRVKGKSYLLAYSKVDLMKTSLMAVSRSAPYRQRFQLYTHTHDASPKAGLIELELMHVPRASGVDEDENTGKELQDFSEEEEEEEEKSSKTDKLYDNLPLEERKTKLEAVMTEVQNQIDLEFETKAEFERLLDETNDPDVKQRLLANLAASDERKDLLWEKMFDCMSQIKACDEEVAS